MKNNSNSVALATELSDSKSPKKRDQSKLAALSSFVGSSVEYYDFGLFGSAAALVFGPIFFNSLDTTGAILASMATFGVAYLARPLGSILFGWLGDKYGRRKALIWALTLMGVCTFLIGTLPGAATLGVFAPILLVILRIGQGISAGGEQGGSNSLTLEHAPKGKRGLYTSWTQQGSTFGSLLGWGVFAIVASLPTDILLGWAWRIPFLIAGPMMLFSLWIRAHVKEPEAFNSVKSQNKTSNAPIRDVLKNHWREVLIVVFCTLTQIGAPATTVYGLGYAATEVGMDANKLLLIIMGSSALVLLWVPMWAKLSDKFGRRPIFIITSLATAPLFSVYFWSLSTGSYTSVFIATLVLYIFSSGGPAVAQSFYTELFPTKVRYTGSAFSMQLGFVVAGFAPTIMTAIQGTGTNGWIPVAIFTAAGFIIASISAFISRETATAELQ